MILVMPEGPGCVGVRVGRGPGGFTLDQLSAGRLLLPPGETFFLIGTKMLPGLAEAMRRLVQDPRAR